MIIHSEDKSHACDICEKKVYTAKNFVKHKHIHTGENLLAGKHCNVCGKLIKRTSQLKEHLLFHSGEKPHACNICGKKVYTDRNFKETFEFILVRGRILVISVVNSLDRHGL